MTKLLNQGMKVEEVVGVTGCGGGDVMGCGETDMWVKRQHSG